MDTMKPTYTVHEGRRYRLKFRNASDDIHPLHLHRHSFELTRIAGKPTAGVIKDVVMLGGFQEVEFDFVADNPGLTLFHCHQQLHMDFGFMALFNYAWRSGDRMKSQEPVCAPIRSTRPRPRRKASGRFAARSSAGLPAGWVSLASAGRSLISAISATSSSCAAGGSTSTPMPISWGSANSCPGPASSQVGFSIGLMRGGYRAVSRPGPALPCLRPRSRALRLRRRRTRWPVGTGLLHGLKLVAVAIVAQAVWGMARSLCPDRERASIAVAAALIILFSGVAHRPDRRDRCSAASPACSSAAAPRLPATGHVAVPVSRSVGSSPSSGSSFSSRVARPARLRSRQAWRCSTRSTAPARWSSAAAMSCCRCYAKLWSRPAG